ncbi:MAG: hypothetical protein CFH34_00340 [Alphaproteobacteria bacterium MarineAlpha9_Bin4]|nr:hypothetical protein [Pelagibacterales bacterium]PPR27306.1 MAG: hypothetical protein CFH34_00340 [Alphaproteobacteria bacterium MarineAlpha9_Bin4]|tara:strand:+ start:413 stop:1648 length:1236 start_codon:yes stop_codon:yes gene_type:complete
MKKFILKSIILLFTIIFLNNCSVGDLTDLWPTGSEENGEVVIREIPGESFDPEESEDIEVTANTSDGNDITIIDQISDNNDEGELVEETSSDSNLSYEANPDVEAIQTYVGDRVSEMREEFSILDNEIKENENLFNLLKSNGIASAEVYHSTVAAIAARLQIGTTPGNPVLLNQYERALTELAEVGSQGQQLVELGNQISLLSARVSYLKDQTRSAKRLRGAVDEDHRKLSVLQDDIKRKGVDLTRLLENLNETIRRRDIYLAAERRRLTQLASAISIGESYGNGLGPLNSIPASNDDESSEREKRSDTNLSGNPIAVIRIQGESNKFSQGLYGAVSAALERAPNATFTLVAVSSTAGNSSEKAARAAIAREKAGKIISSLVSMGMPADRLSVTELALASIEDTEVRVYTD